jgi:broad specificity phosphatase PhoE
MATLYLVRHGQASFGSDDYDRLSPLGERQASLIGRYFAACGIQPDRVFSGSLRRQRDTAALALAALPQAPAVEVDVRFNEIAVDDQIAQLGPAVLARYPELAAFAERAHSSSKDYQKLLRVVFAHWVALAEPPPGLESYACYADKVQAALRDAMAAGGSGRSVCIFTSGGTIATAVAQVLGLAGEHTYTFYEPMMNASITRLLYRPGQVSLSSYNDTSFLDLLGRQQGESLLSYR